MLPACVMRDRETNERKRETEKKYAYRRFNRVLAVQNFHRQRRFTSASLAADERHGYLGARREGSAKDARV